MRRCELTQPDSITEISNAVVGGFDLGALTQDSLLQCRRQIVFSGFLEFFNSRVFAAFAFSEDGMFVAARDRRFQIDPTAMQGSGSAVAIVLLLVAESTGFGLQRGCEP